MNKYDAYLFDWDGTLASTLEIWLDIIREQLGQHAVGVSDHEIVLKCLGRLQPGAQELGMPQTGLIAFKDRVGKIAGSRVPTAPLYPQAKEALETLRRQGKKLALISSSYRDILHAVVAQHGLTGLFDVIVSGDDVTHLKPHPESLHLAMRQLKAGAARTLMLGDSDKDLGAAQSAGTDSVLFYPKSHEAFYPLSELKAFQPTYTIHSWQELLDALQ
ncbi:MAG TPA: HAD family hydrolase [Nevskiaceae bacterium]|nr:HAD family hydrolase [Nevskiaceae bacterium]